MNPVERCKDIVGRRVVLLRDVKTKRQRFPAGSVMSVRQTHRGTFSLYSAELGYVLRVSRQSFDPLPPVHSVPLAFCTGCAATFHRWRDVPEEYQCECYGLVKMVDANHPHNRTRHAG